MQKEKLILGSTSPRRAEVLSFFNLPFEVIGHQCDEEVALKKQSPEAFVRQLARDKALTFSQKDRIILTADTIVEHEGTILGKPRDEDEAFEMLKRLNGTWHTVYTALCGKRNDRLTCHVAASRILFHQATEAQLAAYHDSYHGRDKAGGYGVQEGGAILVKKIEGCFYSVLGLPISPLVEVLADFGVDLWRHLKPS